MLLYYVWIGNWWEFMVVPQPQDVIPRECVVVPQGQDVIPRRPRGGASCKDVIPRSLVVMPHC
ncbi:hypothetical protein DEO72_LG7g460 [Vigna unguiculata]|uniref:Uncharacterized protein n=1 Tax=Vigna unguiculata TaxID=3917 RepID=A0A4D6MCS0_VIGUN|nr:hypothetical protein DEO72_LG7g460 [Vigna unguiculata]